jgi:hypothetical protein
MTMPKAKARGRRPRSRHSRPRQDAGPGTRSTFAASSPPARTWQTPRRNSGRRGAARGASESWPQIGAALDTTREAAYQRFGHATERPPSPLGVGQESKSYSSSTGESASPRCHPRSSGAGSVFIAPPAGANWSPRDQIARSDSTAAQARCDAADRSDALGKDRDGEVRKPIPSRSVTSPNWATRSRL